MEQTGAPALDLARIVRNIADQAELLARDTAGGSTTEILLSRLEFIAEYAQLGLDLVKGRQA